MVYTLVIPAFWEAEAGRWQVQEHPGQLGKILSQKKSKNKKTHNRFKKKGGDGAWCKGSGFNLQHERKRGREQENMDESES